jgi:hypothetical protein
MTDSIFEEQRKAYEANQVAWENAMNGARADKRGYLRGSERQKLDRERRHAATTEKPKSIEEQVAALSPEYAHKLHDALDKHLFPPPEVTEETYEPDFDYPEPDFDAGDGEWSE